MKEPSRHSSDYGVYNSRALLAGFAVFMILEAVAVVWVVHVAVGRWMVTVAVAAAFAIVIVASFAYAIRRDRVAAASDASRQSIMEGDVDDRPPSGWFPLPPPGSSQLVRVEQVRVEVGSQRILDIDELVVHEGELVGIAGRNGSGKTTLLRAVGNLIPYRGDIIVEVPLGYMPDRPALYPRLTGTEHLALVMGMREQPRSSRKAAAEEFLERWDLVDAANRRVRGWSLGMRRKLTLALAMCGAPGLLLLDEPGDGLDDESFLELGEAVREHTSRGGAAIVATHDHRILESAHRVVTLDGGSVAQMKVRP